MNTQTVEAGGGLIVGIVAAFFGSWEIALVVFLIYALLLIGNLLTGVFYAKQTDTYDRKKADQATYKKFGMLIAIVILFAVDIMVMGIARSGSITYNVPFFAVLLAAYAAVHELISMLQNLKKLGNKVPSIVEDAANKAEQALNKGKIPSITDLKAGGRSAKK